jgi:NitT/TauT family transport system substrate-binding protein
MMQRMTRRSALGTAAAILAAQATGQAQGLTAIKIAGVPEDSITPALWAQQNGIFHKYGLDVQIDPQRSGSAVASGVAGGAYAIGKSSLIALIAAHAHNVPIVIIAAGGMYVSPHYNAGMIVRTDSPIRTGADLNGKTIAVSSLNDLYTIGVDAWTDKHGGDSSTVKLVELPISAIFEAVINGRVDVGNTINPDLEDALATGKVRFLADTNGAIASQFMYTGWFSTTDYVKSNPRVIQNFRSAIKEAAVYANAHLPQTVDALAKFTGIEPAVVAKMQRITYGTSLDPRLIQPLIDATAKYKVIPAPFDARDLIDPAAR